LFVEQLVNGLTIGIIYALIAVGYSLVFGILRLVNFSHGSVYAFGAHMSLVFISMEFGIIPAIAVSILLTGLLGVAIDKLSLEPLRNKGSKPIAALITTIGISYIIQNMLMILFGSETKRFPQLLNFGSVSIFGFTMGSTQIAIFLISLVLLLVLTFLIQFTKIGLAMRGVEQNPKASYLMGINVNRVITFTFFLGGVSASIAGTLVSSYYQMVFPGMGFMPGLKAFSAAVLGGIGILYGSVFGGLVVGISETMAATYLGGSYRDAIAFVILILVLLIRPNGIFGKKGIKKV